MTRRITIGAPIQADRREMEGNLPLSRMLFQSQILLGDRPPGIRVRHAFDEPGECHCRSDSDLTTLLSMSNCTGGASASIRLRCSELWPSELLLSVAELRDQIVPQSPELPYDLLAPTSGRTAWESSGGRPAGNYGPRISI